MYHLTLIRMVVMKKKTKANVGEDVEKSETCTLLAGI